MNVGRQAWHGSGLRLAQPVLNVAIRVREEGASVSEAALQSELQSVVEQFSVEATAAGWPAAAVQEAAFALVALLDETVLVSVPSLRDSWLSMPLQRRYFNETAAGARFFEHLNRRLGAVDGFEVLEVYYLCLCVGFRGCFSMRGQEAELASIRGRVRDRLGRAGVLGRSCVWVGATRAPQPRRESPSLVALLISVFCLLGALAIHGGFLVAESTQWEEAAARLDALGRDHDS